VAHDYWVYVPAQYDGKTEVSLMVFNDGATYTQPDGYYRAVNVLDNLIYRGELPVMIAAFIDPGKFVKDGASNRQAEYDPPNDRYSRVIVDELLPKLYAEYRITRDPQRHAIAGWSSGAIAAFTVAWERPDQFGKVLSGIGTYVNLAGGHVYPEKVMASERKPIRIFMIDGRNDNRGVNADSQYDQTRDWFYQNVRLKDALVAKGYDVNYAWGIGVHSHDMGGAMLPEMMRWLWRDHPVSVDPNDTIERSFRTGKPAESPATPPPGANPAGAR
jgi:enterochelin esterase family protein